MMSEVWGEPPDRGRLLIEILWITSSVFLSMSGGEVGEGLHFWENVIGSIAPGKINQSQ